MNLHKVFFVVGTRAVKRLQNGGVVLIHP